MKCGICELEDANYRCPRCRIRYCSMLCYKSETHKHQSNEKQKQDSFLNVPAAKSEAETKVTVSLDGRIVELLEEPTLRFHLKIIYELLNDPHLTNESSPESRREIANKKLVNLRNRGAEENKLVEEFCACALRSLVHGV